MSEIKFTILKARIRASTELEKLSDKASGQVSSSLLAGIKRFKKRISIENLMKAVETKSIGHIVKEITWDNGGIEELLPGFSKLDKSFDDSALISFNALPAPIKNNLRTDLKNPAFKKFIDKRLSVFLQDLNQAQSKIVNRAIQRSFTHAQTPRQMAEDIVQHIGLNDRQSIALINYQLGLNKQGASPEKVKRLSDLYESKLLQQRSTMIARTEIQNANNLGQLAVWKSAQDEGLLNADDTFKVWQTDRTPCPSCKAMAGKKVKLNEKWRVPDGRLVDVPSENHPHCYCIQTLEL